MANVSKDLTVFIGRFSPFHNGHAAVIRRALQNSKSVLILIGSSGQARTTKNPFTFAERRQMIMDWFDAEKLDWTKLIVEPLHDHMYNDAAWIAEVQQLVYDASWRFHKAGRIPASPKVYLTGANRDRSTWYLSAFGDLFTQDLVNADDHDFSLSATSIRQRLFASTAPGYSFVNDVPGSTTDFLAEFVRTPEYRDLTLEWKYLENYAKIFESLRYPISIQTVDTCVIQSGHVLAIERDNFPGRGLWAMPGGHLDIDLHERLLDAALRELDEETNIALSPAQLRGSVVAKECFDHPDRSLKARVITMCYLLKLDDTKPLPKVKPQKGEAKRVMWIPIAEALARRDKWFDDHHAMLETMISRLP